MKNLLILLLACATLGVFAQRATVNDARIPKKEIQIVDPAGNKPPVNHNLMRSLTKEGEIFTHGFETGGNDVGSFDPDWTLINTTGADIDGRIHRWTRSTTSLAGGQHTGSACAWIQYNATGVSDHNTWLISPGIELEEGVSYAIKFWVNVKGYETVKEKFEVKIGETPTATGMTDFLWNNQNSIQTEWLDYTIWHEVTATFVPTKDGEFYLGFHAFSPPGGTVIAIDDISITVQSGRALQHLTTYPYTKVPSNQILPPAKVKNTGQQALNNVVLNAELNDASVGSSAAVTLNPEEEKDLPLTIEKNVPEGMNVLYYDIDYDGNDGEEAFGKTFTFTGTRSLFAQDGVTVPERGLGSQGTTNSFGMIYNITKTTNISQVEVGFGPTIALDYSISLYRMVDERMVDPTPLFTQPASRPKQGFYIVNVPSTELEPGNYFLCVNQLGTSGQENITVAYDGDPQRLLYVKATDENQINPVSSYGAIAVRMITEVENCTSAPQPTNLQAVAGYTDVLLSWDGTTPMHYRVTLVEGENQTEYFTTADSILIENLPSGVTYSWSVAAACDAVNGGDPAHGTDFTTIACDPVTEFPWFESFGDEYAAAQTLPGCWFTHRINGVSVLNEWQVRANQTPYDDDAYLTHPDFTNTDHLLITNPFKVPATGYYALEFYSKVLGANAYDGVNVFAEILVSTTDKEPSSFQPIKRLDKETGEVVNLQYQKITVALDQYQGDTIFIAFRYKTASRLFVWYIDAMSIKEFSLIDVAVADIVKPLPSNANLTATEPLTVMLKNNGGAPITGFDLKVDITGGTTPQSFTETCTGTVPATGTLAYTLTTPVNFSEAKAYTVKVKALLTNDEEPNNDSVIRTITNQICGTVTVTEENPYIVGFEGNGAVMPDCWINERIKGTADWQIVASGGEPAEPHGGSYKAYFNPGGGQDVQYCPSARLIMPPLNVSQLTNPALSFHHASRNGGAVYTDTLKVFYKTSKNGEWKLLATYARYADWTRSIIALPEKSSDYYISFVGIGVWGRGVQLDDIEVIDNLITDLEVNTLIAPVTSAGMTDHQAVTVLLKNNGLPISQFKMTLNIDDYTFTKTYDSAMPSMSEKIFSIDTLFDFSVSKAYNVKVTAEVTGDAVPENNFVEQRIASFLADPVELIGFRVYDMISSPLAFVSFSSNNTGKTTIANNYQPASGANVINAGTMVNGYYYTYTLSSTGTGVALKDFAKINTHTWTNQIINPIKNGIPNEMTYDATTNTIYAIATSAVSSLVTVSPEDGTLTAVNSLQRFVIALAANAEGELFAIDLDGILFKIDKQTGNTTDIGNTGIAPAEYPQSMTFDQNTGRLFWAAVLNDASFSGVLIEIDPVSAMTLNRGMIAMSENILGLFTYPNEIALMDKLPASDKKAHIDAEVMVVFTQAITESDLSGIKINGNTVTASIVDGYKIVLQHADFEYDTDYTVVIPAGAVAEWDEEITWTFHTFTEEEASITENVDKQTLSVYPNPAKNVLYIETEQDIRQITVFDLQGKPVMQANGNQRTLNIQALKAGNYLVRIQTENGVITKKIIKQ